MNKVFGNDVTARGAQQGHARDVRNARA
jgi:hypothetical protein